MSDCLVQRPKCCEFESPISRTIFIMPLLRKNRSAVMQSSSVSENEKMLKTGKNITLEFTYNTRASHNVSRSLV